VCMCACVHVCMCACVHVCMCACVHVCMCACVHACRRRAIARESTCSLRLVAVCARVCVVVVVRGGAVQAEAAQQEARAMVQQAEAMHDAYLQANAAAVLEASARAHTAAADEKGPCY
jgi:hypothetical protein